MKCWIRRKVLSKEKWWDEMERDRSLVYFIGVIAPDSEVDRFCVLCLATANVLTFNCPRWWLSPRIISSFGVHARTHTSHRRQLLALEYFRSFAPSPAYYYYRAYRCCVLNVHTETAECACVTCLTTFLFFTHYSEIKGIDNEGRV